MKSKEEILHEFLTEKQCWSLNNDIHWKESGIDNILSAMEYYAKQGSINTNVVRPESEVGGGELLATEAHDTVAAREEINKAFDWLTPEKAARLTKPIKWDAGKSSEGQP